MTRPVESSSSSRFCSDPPLIRQHTFHQLMRRNSFRAVGYLAVLRSNTPAIDIIVIRDCKKGEIFKYVRRGLLCFPGNLTIPSVQDWLFSGSVHTSECPAGTGRSRVRLCFNHSFT